MKEQEDLRAALAKRRQAWDEYDEWKRRQPRVYPPLEEVLAWNKAMIKVALSHGPFPERSPEEKAIRVARMHKGLATIAVD